MVRSSGSEGRSHRREPEAVTGQAAPPIYRDQPSVLVQLGLLDPSGLPVAGVETARKALDRGLPSNGLIRSRA